MEYDPLTHTWRDTGMEKNAHDKEYMRDMTAMEKAKARALRYESPYDVLTHVKRVGAPESPRPRPVYEPTEPEELPRKPRERMALPSYYWPNGDKDFHIINNRFLHDHDHQAESVRQDLIYQSSDRFSKINHYNPIQGRLYNLEDERRYQEAKSSAECTHGMAKHSKLPVSIKTREGACYDILAPQVIYNRKRMVELEHQDTNDRNGTGLKVEYETELARRSEAARELQLDRGVNRISHQRYEDVAARGYNVLTNQDFKGRGGQAYPAPRTNPPGDSTLRPSLPFSRRPGSRC